MPQHKLNTHSKLLSKNTKTKNITYAIQWLKVKTLELSITALPPTYCKLFHLSSSFLIYNRIYDNSACLIKVQLDTTG